MLISQKETNLCKKLVEEIDNGTVIVTINSRLANFLRQQFDFQQQQNGLQVWQSPDILPFETWLERVWNGIENEKILLNEFQEQLLWEKIIQDSEISPELLRLDCTAQNAQQAWQLLCRWRLTLDNIKNNFNYDVQFFVKLVNKFLKICSQENYLVATDLMELILKKIKKDAITLPKKIIFAGFEQLPPQTENFIANLKELKITIEFLENNLPASSQTVIALPDSQQELYTLARWAQRCLAENKLCTIGCVIPNLKEIRDDVERIFIEVFTPFPYLPYHKENLPFNISIGKPLIAYPLVEHGMQILSLALSELIPSAAMSRWLRSPFLAGAEEEISVRALLDKELHEQGENKILLRAVLALAQKSSSSYYCPILAKHLQNFISVRKKIFATRFPSEWSKLFVALLETMGWPGQRSLNSAEFQTGQRWQTMLIEFANLDFLLGEISYQHAINILQKLAHSIIFQPQTQTTPIQILGILEASGLHFDYLWVTGVNDETWPPINRFNPFIPIKIQQQVSMPHASMQIEWKFYQKLTSRLICSTTKIIFSYAQQNEDRTCKVSSLVNHLPQQTEKDLNLSIYASPDQLIFAASALESIEDWQAPAIKDSEIIKGGSNIIKYQAACPFRAFAKFRLYAENVKMPVSGLDYIERGLLIHSALEYIWNHLNDKQQLENYSEENLKKLITTAIDDALLHYIPQKPLTLKKNFATLEQLRLTKILQAWLNYEKRRSAFKVIAKEQIQYIKLGNLALQIRVDRIDQLSDDTHVIIDYKTGKTSIKQWFGERLEEPQLPLYCINSKYRVSGITFAQIYPKEMCFNGIAIHPEHLPDLTPLTKVPEIINKDWKNLLNEWEKNLINISNDFCAGNAKVDPKDLSKNCLYCEFQPLCRIYEKIKYVTTY